MRNIVVDAGPLIALFRKDDGHRQAAVAFLKREDASPFITNMLAVGEAAHVINSHNNVVEMLNWVICNTEIDPGAGSDLSRAIEVIEKYKDLPADLADASLVALCERRGTNLMASVDSDFDVYRLPKGKKFVNVFFGEGE